MYVGQIIDCETKDIIVAVDCMIVDCEIKKLVCTDTITSSNLIENLICINSIIENSVISFVDSDQYSSFKNCIIYCMNGKPRLINCTVHSTLQ